MENAAIVLVVALSAWIQGSVGFGYALVAAPILALIAPELVPGPLILSSMLLSAAAGVRERGDIDWHGVRLALLGRLPGVALGATAMAWLTTETMGLVFGVVVLLGVVLSVSGVRVRMSTRTLLATGFLSGVMGTMTSIGGPPMALLYQDSEGPRLRSTLNTCFAFGAAMSLPALALAGHFGGTQIVAGLILMPAMAAGFLLSGSTRSYLDAGRTRVAVLAVATGSALALVVREVLR